MPLPAVRSWARSNLSRVLSSRGLASFSAHASTVGMWATGRAASTSLVFVNASDPFSWLLLSILQEVVPDHAWSTIEIRWVDREDLFCSTEWSTWEAWAHKDAAELADELSVSARPSHALPIDGEDRRRQNGRLLRRLGHYFSGTILYRGAWYQGPERIEAWLRGQSWSTTEMLARWRLPSDQFGLATPDLCLEWFVSVRSPYAYLSSYKVQALCEQAAVQLVCRPVLPMVMRGLPVPLAKTIYLFMDAGRCSRAADVPFGHARDPLGPGIETAMAALYALQDSRQRMALYQSLGRAIWARACFLDAALVEDCARNADILLPVAWQDTDWQQPAEAARAVVQDAGLWGVPTFRLFHRGTLVTQFWGQDRFYRIGLACDALRMQPEAAR